MIFNENEGFKHNDFNRRGRKGLSRRAQRIIFFLCVLCDFFVSSVVKIPGHRENLCLEKIDDKKLCV